MKLKASYLATCLLAAAVFLPSSMRAEVLYSYNFSGSGDMNGQNLNGQTWYGSAINADGSYSLANGGEGYQSFGWQFQDGYLYDFKVTINQTSGSWAGIGIATSFGIWNMVAAGSDSATIITTGEAWKPYQTTGALGNGTYRIRLDTTGTNWTATFYKDNVQVGSPIIWSGRPAFGASPGTTYAYLGLVALGNGATTAGTFSNLELSGQPAVAAPPVSTPVLYSYDFSGSGDMNGQTLNGQTWYGLGIDASGIYSYPSGWQNFAQFGWILLAGGVYDLSVTINQTSGSWAGIGIAKNFGMWNLIANNNDAVSYITTGDTWGGGSYQGGLDSGSGTYRIRVDTTGTNWTATFYKDGYQAGSTRTWTGQAPFGPSGALYGYAQIGLAVYGNGVATTGTFSNLVFSGGPTLVPTNISHTVSGDQLTLSWPASYTGWTLQANTNLLATNSWVRVDNSGQTNQMTVTIDPAKPTEFYRLVYP